MEGSIAFHGSLPQRVVRHGLHWPRIAIIIVLVAFWYSVGICALHVLKG